MRVDNRLSRVIHALLHLNTMDGPATSETLSKMLRTNPTVVRRTMSGLRENGIVHSSKGHHGGWSLAKPLNEISLYSLYKALGMPRLFAMSAGEEETTCLVQQISNEVVSDALEEAKSVFIANLEKVTLESLNKEFIERLSAIHNEGYGITCAEEGH